MRRDNLLEIRKMIVLKHLKPPCERYRVLPARLKAPYGWRLRSIQWTGSSFPLEWGSPENNHKIRCLRGAIPGTHDHFDARPRNSACLVSFDWASPRCPD